MKKNEFYKLMLSLIVLLTIADFNISNAQPLIWQKTYYRSGDDNAYSVTQTFDGGYLISGQCNKGTLVMKINAFGDSVWSRIYQGIASNSIIQSADSNFVMVGQITNDTLFFPKGYILKIDQAGNILWSKLYGGNYRNTLSHLIELSDLSLIIIGTRDFQLPPPFIYSIYLLKTNKNGVELWSRTYDSTGKGFYIREIQGKGFLISGSTSIYVNYDGNVKYKHLSLGTGLCMNSKSEFIFMMNELSGSNKIRIIKTDTLFNVNKNYLIQKMVLIFTVIIS